MANQKYPCSPHALHATHSPRAPLSPYATPSVTRAVLERHGLSAKYGLGQNFLVNDDIIRKILELAEVQPTDYILEVGPGIGTLTYPLAAHAEHITAIEKDADLPAVLADTMSEWNERFTLLQKDALEITADELACSIARPITRPTTCENAAVDASVIEQNAAPKVIASCAPQASAAPAAAAAQLAPRALPNKLVSNLPYAVAATLVLHYLQNFDFLESATVMVQKEVADRMCARPGTKAYGAYSVKLALYAQPVGRFSVAPSNFFPPPHVESTVLRLDRAIARDENSTPLSPAQLKTTCRIADAAFANRRKTLANSCKTYFAESPVVVRLQQMFTKANIDPRRRGESLSQAEFIRLGLASCELLEP